MSGLFRKIDCHSLPVANLDSAIEFYQEKLGHELIWRSGEAAGLRFPQSDAELVLHTDARPIETDLFVDSVTDAIQQFKTAGGTVVSGPFDIAIGKCAVLRDPWGNDIIILDTSKGLLQVDPHKNVIK